MQEILLVLLCCDPKSLLKHQKTKTWCAQAIESAKHSVFWIFDIQAAILDLNRAKSIVLLSVSHKTPCCGTKISCATTMNWGFLQHLGTEHLVRTNLLCEFSVLFAMKKLSFVNQMQTNWNTHSLLHLEGLKCD